VNDVEERKHKEAEALKKKKKEIDGEIRGYFKPKINPNSSMMAA
jgi:hypothetical protein